MTLKDLSHITIFTDRVNKEIDELSINGDNKNTILAVARNESFWNLNLSQDTLQHYINLHTLLSGDPISVMALLGNNEFTANEIVDAQQNILSLASD